MRQTKPGTNKHAIINPMRSKYRIFFAECECCGQIGAALCPSMARQIEEEHMEAMHTIIIDSPTWRTKKVRKYEPKIDKHKTNF